MGTQSEMENEILYVRVATKAERRKREKRERK